MANQITNNNKKKLKSLMGEQSNEQLEEAAKISQQTSSLSDFEETKRTIVGMHEDGTLGDYISKVLSQFGVYITVAAMLVFMPAMPVIFYLTILYNVILLTWENFKALDTDNIKE